MDKRGEGRREYHDFPSKNVCLTVPKNFVGETFSVSLISGIERFYASEIYLTILCRNFFCLSAEKFRRGAFLICVSEKICYRKKLWIRGGGEGRREYHDFQSKILSHNSEKFRRGILLFLRNILVSKRFMHEKGGITFFRP